MRSPSKHRWLLVATLLCASLVGARVARADPLEEMERQQQVLFDRIAPSVVFISIPGSLGSGFFVGRDGLILTNQHVVGDESEVTVVLHDGRRFRGRVIARAEGGVDLAMVKIALESTPALPLGGGDLRIGTWVAAIGHGMGGIWTYTTGMVSNIYPLGTLKPMFQTQIPLNPGTSGGPIFDRKGRVLGVCTAGIKESNSINFAIRIEKAFDALPRLASSCDCLVITAPANVPIFVDGKLAGKGPRVVLPAEKDRTYSISAVIGGQMREAQLTFPAQRQLQLR